MPPRKLSMPDPADSAQAPEPEVFSQRKRPDPGRYLLQVDRQTKTSYQTAEAAQAAGLVIKKGYPNVQVTIYDTIDHVGTSVSTS
jgi:hypothetical protein